MWIFWRLAINAAALWAATRLVPGISFDGDWRLLIIVALVFGVVNASLRPILMVLTLPLLILTLGLFTFILNALMLWVTSAISDALGVGFHVSGFWAAFLGALVVTVVSFLLSLFVRANKPDRSAVRRED
jgi:putative membrane protein